MKITTTQSYIFRYIAKTLAIFLIFLSVKNTQAQAFCNQFQGFCSSTPGGIQYQNSTGTTAPSGPDYACLSTVPNPAWYFMQIGTSGVVKMQIKQTSGTNGTGSTLDVDFAMWGPFTDLAQACTQIANGTAKPIQSSYSIANTETVGIGAQGGSNSICNHGSGQTTPATAVAGQFYIIMITNYSNQAGYITFNQTNIGAAGAGVMVCPSCNVSAVTAVPSSCNTSNSYDVSGVISVTGFMNSGNFVVTNSCGGSQTIPVVTGATSYNYNITGLAAPATAGNCTVTVKYSADATCTNTKTYSPPVRPIANAGNNSSISCAVPSTVIGTPAVSGNSYTWSPAIGLSSNTVAQPTVSLPNTYTVTVTNIANSCTSTDAVTVTQTGTLPTANAGPDDSLTCIVNSIKIGTPAISGNTYAWSPAVGLDNPAIAQPIATSPNTYILTVTNTSTGCIKRDTVIIKKNITPPIANAGVDDSITCTVSTIQIGTPAIAGYSYSWSSTIGLTAPLTAQPNANTPGTYTLTVRNNVTGCTATDNVKISIDTIKPVANAGADKVLTCANTVFVLGSGNVPTYSYAWTPSTGLNNAAIANPRDSLPNTYYLTVTNTINGCTDKDTVVVTQNITPPLANAGPNQLLNCIDKVFVLGTANDPANTYKWTPSNGLNNPNIAQPRDSLPNRYQLLVRNIANGCISTDSVFVSQDISTPIANAGRDSVLTCTTTQLTLGTPAVAGNTYVWTPVSGLFGSGAASAQPSDSLPNTFYLTVTKTINGCTAKDTVKITQNITKPVANAGTNKVLTCANTVFVLGTNNVPANSYAWTPAAGLNNPAIANPRDSLPNTYYLTVTNTINGCTDKDTVVVTQNITPPIADAGPNQLLNCYDKVFVLGTANDPANTYKWTPSTGLNNPNIAQPRDSLPNRYQLLVRNIANGCVSIDSVVVTQDISTPIADAGRDSVLTCITTQLTLGTPAISGNTYVWTPVAGLFGSGAAAAQPADSLPNTFYLTVTKTVNGCSAKDTVKITQNIVKPVANAGADKVLTCANTVFVLGTNNVPANSYAWTPSAGLNNPAIANPRDSLANTYYLTVTNNINGCIDKDTVVVTQNITPPIADAGANQLLNCYDKVFVLGTANDPANTYKWSPAVGLNNPNIGQPRDSLPNRYQLLVRNIANGCVSIDSVVVTQDISTPFADAGRDSVLTCTTTQLTLGTPAISGNTYVWTPVAGLFGSGAAAAQPTDSLPNTFYLTVTKTINGCTAKDTVKITQNITKPAANAGADKVLTCANTVFVLGSNNVPANSYAWTPSAGLNNPAIANPRDSLPNTYYLTVTNTINGCTKNDTVAVTKDITPPVADAGIAKTLTCANPSLPIGTPAITGNTYAWSPASGISAPNTAQPDVNKTGTFTVTVTNTANGCISTDNVNISIDTIRPFADAGINKTLTCAIPTVTIGSAAVSGNTYSWLPVSGLDNSFIAQPKTNTYNNYTVTVTKNSNGCKATDEVIILQNITTSAAIGGNDLTLTCTHQSLQIGAPSVAGNSYSWSPSAGLSNPSAADPTVNKPGIYTLTVTNLANGCTSDDVVNIFIDTIRPVANAGLDNTLNCTTTSLSIGTRAISGNTYSWSPVSGLNTAAVAQPIANKTGVYTVTVTKTANGCISTDAMEVLIDTVRPVAYAGEDQTFGCPHIPLTIGTPGLSNMAYYWTRALGLSENNIAQPITDTSGTFVLMVVNTVNHCKSAPDTVVITPKNCDCTFYVPTAFSPNNDGINDVLAPLKDCDDFKDFTFSIFNRWGELVFKSNDISIGWDGIYKNESMQDSFLWTLEYFDKLYNTKRFQKGVVVLLK